MPKEITSDTKKEIYQILEEVRRLPYTEHELDNLGEDSQLFELVRKLEDMLKAVVSEGDFEESFLAYMAEILTRDDYLKLWVMSQLIEKRIASHSPLTEKTESSTSAQLNSSLVKILLKKLISNNPQLRNDLFFEKDLVVFDVDGTLIGKKGYNNNLIHAVFVRGYEEGLLMTNMDLSDFTDKAVNEGYKTRYDIIEFLKNYNMTTHGVSTPADPAYNASKKVTDSTYKPRLGAAFREIYLPLYEGIFGMADKEKRDEQCEKLIDGLHEECNKNKINFAQFTEDSLEVMRERAENMVKKAKILEETGKLTKKQVKDYHIRPEDIKFLLLEEILIMYPMIRSILVCEDDPEQAAALAKLSLVRAHDGKYSPKISFLNVDMVSEEQTEEFYDRCIVYHQTGADYLTEEEKVKCEKFFILLQEAEKELIILQEQLKASASNKEAIVELNGILQALEILRSSNIPSCIKSLAFNVKWLGNIRGKAKTFADVYKESGLCMRPVEIFDKVITELSKMESRESKEKSHTSENKKKEKLFTESGSSSSNARKSSHVKKSFTKFFKFKFNGKATTSGQNYTPC